MKELRLSLISKWFEITQKLIKKEDYRNITPYWCNRFILVYGQVMSKKWWELNFMRDGERVLTWIIDNIAMGNFTFKPFTHNIMTLGYPSNSEVNKFKKFEHAGIEIGYGKEEWGAEPNKLYFIIKHGKQLIEIELDKEVQDGN